MALPVLSGITDALSAYQRAVPDTLAGSALLGLNRLKMGLGMGDPGSDQLAQLGTGLPGSNPGAALDFMFRDNPVGRFGATTAADPMTYLGLGLPGRLAGLGLVKGLPMAEHALQGLDVLDKIPGQATGKVLDMAGNAIKEPALKLGDILAPMADRFGDAHPLLRDNWTTSNLIWKQLAHSIPGYHVLNFGDDTLRMAANGDFNAVKDALTPGGTVTDRFTSELGRDMPSTVGGKAANIPEDSIFTGTSQMTSGFKPLPFNNWVDRQTGPVRFGLDRLKQLTEANMHFETGMEGRLRGAEFGSGAIDSLKSGAANTVAEDLRAQGRHDLADMLSDRDFIVHPDELKLHLLDQGLSPANAKYYSETLGLAQDAAEQAGNQRVKDVLFDYTSPPRDQMRPGERFFRDTAQNTFGGYKFATNNVPAFMRLAGAHPGLASVPTDYYRNSDYYNALHGLGPSYHGQMPLGQILGHDVSFNPGQLSSLAELVGAATEKEPQDDMGPAGQLANNVGDLGFGLNPFLKAALIVSGQEGNRQLPDIIRPLSPVSAAAGLALGRPVDLEGGLKSGVAALEHGLTGRNTSSFQDYLIRKRQVELANADPFAATQTSGPVHDQAQLEVSHDQAVEQLLRFVGIPGFKLSTPEEKEIKLNEAIGRIAAAHGNPNPARQNPTAGAYDLVDPINEKIMNFTGLPPLEQAELLKDPVIRQKVLEERSRLLHAAPGGYKSR